MRVAKRWEDHFAACIYCLSTVIGALLHLAKLFYEPVFDHQIGVVQSVQCIHFVAAQTQHSLRQYAHKCLYIFYKHSTNDDFKELCELFKKHGIHIILDGVFSHTGDDSIYFNKIFIRMNFT